MAVAVSRSRPVVHSDELLASPPRSSQSPAPAPSFLVQARDSLRTVNDTLKELQDRLESIWNDLCLFTKSERKDVHKVGRSRGKAEATENPDSLHSAVSTALATASSQVESLCLRRRGSQEDCRRSVGEAMEALEDHIWQAIQTNWDKPAAQIVKQTASLVETVRKDLDSLGGGLCLVLETIDKAVQEAAQPLEEAIQPESAPVPLAQLRPALLSLLDSVVSTVQALHSDAEGWRARKEALLIRQRIENLCRSYEETGRFQHDPSLDNIDELSAGSKEEVEEALVKQVQESQGTVLDALKEQKQGIDVVGMTQASLQQKQEVLESEISAIKGKLDQLFPGQQVRSVRRGADTAKGVALLKSFAPFIRAIDDEEFVRKLTDHLAGERQERDTLLRTVLEEGYAVDSLQEVAREFRLLKASYVTLRDSHEEALLKSIKAQSEFEAELAYQQTQVEQLKALSQPCEKEMAQLRAKLDELTIENVKLKVECSRMRKSKMEAGLKRTAEAGVQSEALWAISVLPSLNIPPKVKPFRKEKGINSPRILTEESETQTEAAASVCVSDEELLDSDTVLELRQRVQDRIDVLMTISEEEQALESRVAVVEEEELRTTLQALSSAHSRYDETFEEIQSLKEAIEREKQMQRAQLTVLPTTQHLLSNLEALFEQPFQVCGAVGYCSHEWALVRQGAAFLWVRPETDRAELTAAERAEQHREACRLLTCSDLLPTISQLLTRP